MPDDTQLLKQEVLDDESEQCSSKSSTSTTPEPMNDSLPCTSPCICCGQRLDLLALPDAADRAWRVCECRTRFVHYDCARADSDWALRRCLDCAQRFKVPPVKNTINEMPTPLRLSMNGNKCSLCDNNRVGLNGNSSKNDLRWVRPCFCERDVHHICMVDMLRKEKICEHCGVKYAVFTYGSMRDFFVYYLFEYSCSCVVYTSFLFVAALMLYLTWTGEDYEKFVFGCLFLLFFSVPSLLFYMWMSWTFKKRFPRFKKRFGQISVCNYKPELNSKHGKEKRKLNKARAIEEHSTFLREWTVSSVLRGNNGPLQTTSTPKDGMQHQARFTFSSPSEFSPDRVKGATLPVYEV